MKSTDDSFKEARPECYVHSPLFKCNSVHPEDFQKTGRGCPNISAIACGMGSAILQSCLKIRQEIYAKSMGPNDPLPSLALVMGSGGCFFPELFHFIPNPECRSIAEWIAGFSSQHEVMEADDGNDDETESWPEKEMALDSAVSDGAPVADPIAVEASADRNTQADQSVISSEGLVGGPGRDRSDDHSPDSASPASSSETVLFLSADTTGVDSAAPLTFSLCSIRPHSHGMDKGSPTTLARVAPCRPRVAASFCAALSERNAVPLVRHHQGQPPLGVGSVPRPRSTPSTPPTSSPKASPNGAPPHIPQFCSLRLNQMLELVSQVREHM